MLIKVVVYLKVSRNEEDFWESFPMIDFRQSWTL